MHPLAVERYDAERVLMREILDVKLDPAHVDTLDNAAFRELAGEIGLTIGAIEHPRVLEELFAAGALHGDPDVRKIFLRAAERRCHTNRSARELILWLLGDDEDHVVFEAVRIAGRQRLGEAIDELVAISGKASKAMHASTKPVGVGASLVIGALTSIYGTRDADELLRLEEAFERDGRLPDGTDFAAPGGASAGAQTARAGMTYVPGGPFLSGLDPEHLATSNFDTNEVMPRVEMTLPGFLIDTYPVTNREYDAWAASQSANDHRLCHSDEPPGKDHRRGTRRDERLLPDHPAVGVDWYDAYAYCANHGKELPSEFEWEKAARGTDGRLFPWGDRWEPGATRWAGETFGVTPEGIHEWRALLERHDEQHPAHLTTPVTAHPSGASPYGVMDLVGNAWEWTRTNFFTRDDMVPQVAGRPRPEWAYSPESFAVIKGGAWSSIPEESSAFFRGKDLFTDRHNEIGFRGVIR